jgi:hypothetical protein
MEKRYNLPKSLALFVIFGIVLSYAGKTDAQTPGTLYGSTGNADNTLIMIDPATGQGILVDSLTTYGPVTEIEFRDDGVLFGATGRGTSYIITIDPVTGVQDTLLGRHPYGATNGLEFNNAGDLWGSFYDANAPVILTFLVLIDHATGMFAANIGLIDTMLVTGLALHPNGTLYGVRHYWGGPSELIIIDPGTGVAIPVGMIGFNAVGALEFGPGGVLYGGIGVLGGAFAGFLITIDINTGVGTPVGFTGFPAISGLSFYPPINNIDDDSPGNTPSSLRLLQNYPNPFNPQTTIEFQLPKSADVILSIYDIKGNVIIEYVQGILSAGKHSILWNGKNESGDHVASGMYFYRIEAKTKDKTFIDVKKMIFMK